MSFVEHRVLLYEGLQEPRSTLGQDTETGRQPHVPFEDLYRDTLQLLTAPLFIRLQPQTRPSYLDYSSDDDDNHG